MIIFIDVYNINTMKNKKTKRQQSKIAKKGKNRTKRTRSKKGGANDGNNFGKKKISN